MTITTITKKVTITKKCGCSVSMSLSQVFIDGVLQSSPEKIKEVENVRMLGLVSV